MTFNIDCDRISQFINASFSDKRTWQLRAPLLQFLKFKNVTIA